MDGITGPIWGCGPTHIAEVLPDWGRVAQARAAALRWHRQHGPEVWNNANHSYFLASYRCRAAATVLPPPLPFQTMTAPLVSPAAGPVAAGRIQALVDMPDGQACRVVGVQAPAAVAQWAERLAEIGFIAGERVQVLSRGLPGGDPLAVRIGSSTFALRRAEAACVRVEVLA